jgi:hypothetical protein
MSPSDGGCTPPTQDSSKMAFLRGKTKFAGIPDHFFTEPPDPKIPGTELNKSTTI